MKTLEQAGVISKTDRELLREIKMVIQGFLPEAEILLYGSVPRGTQEPESDYDILALTDDPLPFDEQDVIRDAIYDFELSQDVVFSTIFNGRSEWNAPPISGSPFRHSVEEDAVVL